MRANWRNRGRNFAGAVAGTAALIKNTAYLGNVARNVGQRFSQKQADTVVRQQMKAKKKVNKAVRKYKRKTTVKGKVTALERKVKKLSSETLNGTLIHRIRDVDNIRASSGLMLQKDIGGFGADQIEDALANTQFFNPSAPGTLIANNAATGTYARNFIVKPSSKLVVRNNYEVPAELRLYMCKVKGDTAITPDTAYDNGISDISSFGSTSTFAYPSEVPQINDIWNVDNRFRGVIEPGKQLVFQHYGKEFKYDPSTYDSHALTYQKEYGSFSWLVRANGVVGHDNAADQNNLCGAGVDMLCDTKIKIRYDAGGNLYRMSVTNNADTFSGTGIVSNYNGVINNQGYSIT